jgi:recombination protein RecT
MKCEPESVLRSALRAASLELSCDPALKQAYLVPIRGKAEFWPHYRGLYNLAQRTGKYLALTVTPVREGQQVFQHNVTGMHYLVIRDGLMVENDQLAKLYGKGYREVTTGAGDEKIIGYLGYFKMTNGFEKTVYMSLSEIVEHAEKYAPGNYHNPKSDWNDPKHRPTMEMKTVLRELLRWCDLSGKANEKLRAAMNAGDEEQEWASDDDVMEAIAKDMPDEITEPIPDSIYPVETLAAIVGRVVPDLKEAAAILALSCMPPEVEPAMAASWAITYNGELLQGDKAKAIKIADAAYLKAIKAKQDAATDK